MIKEISINKEISENDDKSKKFDSLIRAYNEKGLFPFTLDNPNQQFSTKDSPSKSIFNKQRLEFSSLRKDNYLNNLKYSTYSGNKIPDYLYEYKNNQLFDLSDQKDFLGFDNNKKELYISGHKRITKKLDNEFEGLIFSKNFEKETNNENLKDKYKKDHIKKRQKYPITLTINDSFFDSLVDIYTNQGIEIGFQYKDKNISKIQNNNFDYNNNSNNININLKENISNTNSCNSNINSEQISCICLKSKCLNNYCSCHKNGNLCNKNCRCINCKNVYNNINNNNSNLCTELKKNKCKCKISNCFSCYCECKKRGIACTDECLCINCKNIEIDLKK